MTHNGEPPNPGSPRLEPQELVDQVMRRQGPLTRQQRETFWAGYGWKPTLPATQRQLIEQTWPDDVIREAIALGF